MTPHQKVVAASIAVLLLVAVLELVRRRALRIEYSWLWIFAIVGLLSLVLSSNLLIGLTRMIGAVDSTSTVFMFAFVFLVCICIHFTVKISQLTNQVKKLTQQLAILEAEKTTLERGQAAGEPTSQTE